MRIKEYYGNDISPRDFNKVFDGFVKNTLIDNFVLRVGKRTNKSKDIKRILETTLGYNWYETPYKTILCVAKATTTVGEYREARLQPLNKNYTKQMISMSENSEYSYIANQMNKIFGHKFTKTYTKYIQATLYNATPEYIKMRQKELLKAYSCVGKVNERLAKDFVKHFRGLQEEMKKGRDIGEASMLSTLAKLYDYSFMELFPASLAEDVIRALFKTTHANTTSKRVLSNIFSDIDNKLFYMKHYKNSCNTANVEFYFEKLCKLISEALETSDIIDKISELGLAESDYIDYGKKHLSRKFVSAVKNAYKEQAKNKYARDTLAQLSGILNRNYDYGRNYSPILTIEKGE